MFPAVMETLPQWVVADNNKVPLNPRNLHMASVTDPRTWGTFQQAVDAATRHKLNLGFTLTEQDNLCGIDLDKPVTEQQQDRHRLIYDTFVSYSELSLSGNGIHIIIEGKIPYAVKRDHVEVYDRNRYFIMTGKHIPGRPWEIVNYNDLINRMVLEMGGGQGGRDYIDQSEPAREEDMRVIERCATSANGDRFKPLWKGDWQHTYSSQSEADYALMNMLTFVSPSDEQCRRLFRLSGLGQRTKANRDDYVNTMIGRIRKEQNPQIDFSQFKPPTIVLTSREQPVFRAAPTPVTPTELTFPPGLVGEISQYVLESAIRPITQVSLASGLALVAGIAGRAYNVSHTGLNLYLMLVAGTGVGKEGGAQGVTRLIRATATRLPAIQQFLGPTEYASGQALIKRLHQFPCQLSVLSEFGHTLRRICRPDAIGADIMWRKVLLEVFNKSGAGDVLGEMAYSDTGKNTPAVNSPSLTLLTEASPASLYDGLDEQAIEIGLVPRFLLMECTNIRPPSNPNAFQPPPPRLIDQIETLAHRCLSMEANNSNHSIVLPPDALEVMGYFDTEVDGYINQQNDDAVRQIWNRAHLKALRVSALLAVGVNPDNPTITPEQVEWALNLVRQDAMSMLRRFGEGVGTGDPVQLSKLRHIIVATLQASTTSKLMKQHNVVIHRDLCQRAYPVACFRQDRRGAGEALKRALQALVDGGEIIQLSPQDAKQHFGTPAKCYMLTDGFRLT